MIKWLRRFKKFLYRDKEVKIHKLVVGDDPVLINGNSITLPSLTSNPTLSAGKIWFRGDLKNIVFSPDGSKAISLGGMDIITVSANIANVETTLLDTNIKGVYGGWVLLPAVSATWTVKMYVNGVLYDQVSITTSTTSGLADRLVNVARVAVDGGIITSLKITALSNITTAYQVNAVFYAIR